MATKVFKIGQAGSVKMDTTGLKSLMDAAQNGYVVRVGILGSNASEEHQRRQLGALAPGGGHMVAKAKSSITNAEIGLRHEKGVKSERLERRSWLEMPLREKLPEYFDNLGAKAIAFILQNQPKQVYLELGIVCEQIILKGFETGGYGKWKKLSDYTIAMKGSSTILVDSGQLKKSVTSEVVTA